jgi:hypothetical protein
MPLRPIVAAIKTIEESVSITDPVALSIASKNLSVHRISPPRSVAVTTLGTFMNWPDAGNEARMGDLREDGFTVQVDFLVDVSDADLAADIALAVFDRTWELFDRERESSRRLAGTVDYLTLRAERPMIETIEWAGKSYPGFHIFLDIVSFKESL